MTGAPTSTSAMAISTAVSTPFAWKSRSARTTTGRWLSTGRSESPGRSPRLRLAVPRFQSPLLCRDLEFGAQLYPAAHDPSVNSAEGTVYPLWLSADEAPRASAGEPG
jgi:hypothetical protein